jgi:hypothetical protein
MDINVTGSFNMLCHAAKLMSNNTENDSFNLTDAKNPNVEIQQRGVIINVSSVVGFDGTVNRVAYASTKAAIAGMTLPGFVILFSAENLFENNFRVSLFYKVVRQEPTRFTVFKKKFEKKGFDFVSRLNKKFTKTLIRKLAYVKIIF